MSISLFATYGTPCQMATGCECVRLPEPKAMPVLYKCLSAFKKSLPERPWNNTPPSQANKKVIKSLGSEKSVEIDERQRIYRLYPHCKVMFDTGGHAGHEFEEDHEILVNPDSHILVLGLDFFPVVTTGFGCSFGTLHVEFVDLVD